ncbi:MAG: hypothetical protein KKB20_17670 [Proteobacteria bacterium]|nr:hypothetical protein [Pseudomonadota bacterium]
MSAKPNRPTTKDLVEAVREFLENRIMPAVEGQVAFHARVAANVLAIVERELETGPELDDRERERLSRILGRTASLAELNQDLCRRITDGSLDYMDPALLDHLRRTAVSRLSIDNPKYSAYRRAVGEI